MALALRRTGAFLILSASFVAGASAQQTADLPEIIVTPNYTPTPANRIGSSVSQVSAEAASRTSPASVTQLLRTVPGVTVIESGGPGGTSEIRIRGAEGGHTVVLVDGVRVNDIASARGDFDFASLALDDIERIEVLRGPQSAVYGSDAMGGVINIVTRRQAAASSASLTVEGGSYGTIATRGAAGMRAGDFSVRFAGGYYHSDGFSRRGDRDADERDGVDRASGSVHLSYAPQDGARVDIGLSGVRHNAGYDSVGTTGGDAPNVATRQRTSGFATLTMPTVNDWLDQTATAFFSTYDRTSREPFGSIPETVSAARTIGGEYRAVANLQDAGQLTVGARLEHEDARSRSATLSGFPGYQGSQSLWAVFGEHQLTLADRLHLTFSGRYDGAFTGGEGFLTGRATAAYEIAETGTRLRASVGTGAKRPTAYQIGNNVFAASLPGGDIVPLDLNAERSIGFDAGIEQSLFDGAMRVSATAFYNRFSNMLGFSFIDAAAGTGYYENIDRAETKGIELTADAEIVPGVLSAGATYTWMPTQNLDTGRPLARRPEHSGSVTVTLTPAEGYEASLSAVFVGERLNTASAAAMLPGYGRLDFSTSVALTPSTKIFARVENLLDVRYQDPSGFNSPGLSAYVGLTWKQ